MTIASIFDMVRTWACLHGGQLLFCSIIGHQRASQYGFETSSTPGMPLVRMKAAPVKTEVNGERLGTEFMK